MRKRVTSIVGIPLAQSIRPRNLGNTEINGGRMPPRTLCRKNRSSPSLDKGGGEAMQESEDRGSLLVGQAAALARQVLVMAEQAGMQ